MSGENVLLQINDLKKYFATGHGQVQKAVDGVSLDIFRGETLGLVGESGCGKSTLGRTLMRLYRATSGTVLYNGVDIFSLNRKDAFTFTKKAQIIFQDPYSSLNPRMTLKNIICEGMNVHRIYTGKERNDRVYELLRLVGLSYEYANRFPHEISGGQRQRIGIARALAVDPEFLVCDEPISALDVSVQAQIINLLKHLQNKLGLTSLFISHDLSMVKYISNRVAVMYLGTMVELSESMELYASPLHPYTRALLSSIPIPDPRVEANKKRILIKGEIETTVNAPGCPFSPRCQVALPICREKRPVLREISPGHFIACHLPAMSGAEP